MKIIAGMQEPKTKVGEGEEVLLVPMNFRNKPGREVSAIYGVDCGSTKTQGLVLDMTELGYFEDILEQVVTIPSASITVPGDQAIVIPSEDLYDHLDSHIVNISTEQDVLVKSARIVRATKAMNVELTVNRLGSSTQKTGDPTYYYNLLDFLGYSTMLKYGQEVPEKVHVTLGVSLPPDDLNAKNQERFMRNLKEYRFTHPTTGVTINFIIEKVHVMTEPEAFVKAYYMLSEDELPEYTMHIEGGGRSIGIEILMNGKYISGGRVTLDFGGTQLLQLVNDLYVQKNGGKSFRREALEEAIRVGTIRNGNSRIDMTEYIRQAKEQIARRIATAIEREVFDIQTKVAFNELSVISVSGRLFDKGEYDVSVADYLQAIFKEKSSATEFKAITGSYIPQGLLVDTIIEFYQAEYEAAAEAFEAANAGNTLTEDSVE